MKLNTLVSSHLRFPQVYFKFKLLILSALLLDPGASQEATATTNNYFAALPKCRDSSLGDEIGIPRSLIAVQDLWNNTSESIPIRYEKFLEMRIENVKWSGVAEPTLLFHNLFKHLKLI